MDSTGAVQGKFFKTVKRGQLAQIAEKPAALIKTVDWSDQMVGGVDAVRQKMRLVLAILLDNENIDANVLNDLMERGLAKVQRALENDRKLKQLVIRLTPLGGAETTLEEVVPMADTTLMYEIEWERPRTEP